MYCTEYVRWERKLLNRYERRDSGLIAINIQSIASEHPARIKTVHGMFTISSVPHNL
jgi:hypothetical protein